MENQKQKKSVGTIALVVLLLIVTIASLILATYAWAKYSRSEAGTATANVATWDVDITSDKQAFVGHYNHVVDGKIAPGTEGSFNVSINLGDTEVCVAYQVLLDNVTFTGTDATQMKHLKFFTTRTENAGAVTYTGLLDPSSTAAQAFAGEIELTAHKADNTNTPHVIDSAGTTLTKDSNNDWILTKTIYWVWPYDLTDATAKYGSVQGITLEADGEAYDAVDTAVGEGAVTQMDIGFTVKAWQVAPADADATATGSQTQTTNKPTTNVVDGNPTPVPEP